MNDTTDPEPNDVSSNDALSSSVDLVALLRDEPVPGDELSRERRIRAALADLDEQERSSAPRTARVPAPHRRVSQGWLVAAAVLVLVLFSGFLLLSNRTGTDQLASSDSAGNVATQLEDGRSGAEASPGSDSGSSSDEAIMGELVDLGLQADRDAVIAAAAGKLGEVSNDFAGTQSTTTISPSTEHAVDPSAPTGQGGETGDTTDSAAGRPPSRDELPCVQQLLGAGELPAAVASMDGTAVIVVRRPAGYEVYEVGTCLPAL